jgi:type IV secretion system protein VirD4
VFLFDPLSSGSPCTARYNPFGHIDRRDPIKVIDEVQKIAAMLYPEPPGGDPFWNNRAQQAFIGIAAYVAAVERLAVHDRRESTGKRSATTLRRSSRRSRMRAWSKGGAISQPCRTVLAGYASMPPTTFGGVKGNLTAALGLWVNPNVDAATSCERFRPGANT